MRKVFVLVFLLFFFLFGVSCRAGLTVFPLEVSIVMDEFFISGNTSEKISVRNNEVEDVNVSWYVEDPEPIDLMRPNRTCISNLSWVSVEPDWCVIPSGGSADFFIYLGVPERDDLRGKHWEVWVTFRVLPKQSINVENAVRVYIDTPPVVQRDLSFVFFALAIVAVVFVVFVVFYLKILKR